MDADVAVQERLSEATEPTRCAAQGAQGALACGVAVPIEDGVGERVEDEAKQLVTEAVGHGGALSGRSFPPPLS